MRRLEPVVWWVCVALVVSPLVQVPLQADRVTGVLVIALALLAALTVCLFLRQRWAWWVLVVLSLVALFPVGDFTWWGVARNLVLLVLLLSPPVRRRVFGTGVRFPAVAV